eukprot:1161387-Pelagomonas_calceolata.AAC.2
MGQRGKAITTECSTFIRKSRPHLVGQTLSYSKAIQKRELCVAQKKSNQSVMHVQQNIGCAQKDMQSYIRFWLSPQGNNPRSFMYSDTIRIRTPCALGTSMTSLHPAFEENATEICLEVLSIKRWQTICIELFLGNIGNSLTINFELILVLA